MKLLFISSSYFATAKKSQAAQLYFALPLHHELTVAQHVMPKLRELLFSGQVKGFQWPGVFYLRLLQKWVGVWKTTPDENWVVRRLTGST